VTHIMLCCFVICVNVTSASLTSHFRDLENKNISQSRRARHCCSRLAVNHHINLCAECSL